MNKLKIILQSKWLLFFIIIVIIYCSYCLLFCKPHSKFSGQEKAINGQVIAYNFNDDLLKMTVKSREKIIIYYQIKNEEERKYLEKTLGYGAFVFLNGHMKVLQTNDIPNVFSYQKYLFNQRIFYSFSAFSLRIIPSKNIFYIIKNLFFKRFNNSYVKALVGGVKDDIDKSLFLDNGTLHLFAISGMHISLFISILSFFFYRKKHKNLLILCFLWLYAFLVSFSISVVRVVLFFSFKTFFKKLDNKQIFIIVMGLLLLINPLYCYNLSFIYSFLISFGLIFLLNRKTNVFYLSLFCFFLILPVSASTSYKINFFSIITNLWSILYVSFILYPLALLVFFLPFMLFVFEFFLKIFLFFQQVSLSLAIVFVIPKVSWLLWLLYYYLFYKSLNCKYYWFWLCLLLLFFHYGFKNSNVLVSFISVGQGDCTLLVSPYQREVYLIDVGGNVSDDNYLATNIVTYLNSMGISKVDGLILTHGDYDHAGNTLALISKIPVKKIYINHNSLNDVETSISKVRDVLMFKNLDGFFQIHNLNLSKDSDENMASLVLKVNFYGFRLLLMGDAPSEVENTLKDVKADIIKVGHHGSRGSSDFNFLKRVSPKLAIISAGLNNRYNHPHKETLERLEKLNIFYLNTSVNGTIEVFFKKSSYHIKPLFDTISKK